MKPNLRIASVSLLASTALIMAGPPSQAAVYNGNGDTSFGGAIGGGSLTLTDNGTTVSGTVSQGPGAFNDVLVLYLQTGPGGFASTGGFNDNQDQLRSAISGYSGGSGQQSVMTFAPGFAPNYAVALGPMNNYGGLWQLFNGGAGSLAHIASVNLAPLLNNMGGVYTFSFNLSDLGLTAGQSFELFGTYVSDTGFRSSEAVAGNDLGTPGWNPYTQLAFDTYTTVPEPSALALLGLGIAAGLTLRRRE